MADRFWCLSVVIITAGVIRRHWGSVFVLGGESEEAQALVLRLLVEGVLPREAGQRSETEVLEVKIESMGEFLARGFRLGERLVKRQLDALDSNERCPARYRITLGMWASEVEAPEAYIARKFPKACDITARADFESWTFWHPRFDVLPLGVVEDPPAFHPLEYP